MKQIAQATVLMLALTLVATTEAAETLALDYAINSIEIEDGSNGRMTLDEIHLVLELSRRGMPTLHGRLISGSHITCLHQFMEAAYLRMIQIQAKAYWPACWTRYCIESA